MDLVLNNLQRLICRKTNQPTNQPTNQQSCTLTTVPQRLTPITSKMKTNVQDQ